MAFNFMPCVFFFRMGCWSQFDAMKAYMHSLKLCKDYHNCGQTMEPRCMEFLSALSAGNRAELLMDVAATNGTSATSTTVALAVAARHLGGRLVCVRRDDESVHETRSQLEAFGLDGVSELRAGEPCEVVKQYKRVDFAVVDYAMEGCVEVLFAMDMNPNGSVVVVRNLFQGKGVRSTPFAQMMRGSGRETAVLPIGDGMEITRIEKDGRRRVKRSCKRAFMIYEECTQLRA